jgi:hypothetical protein
MTCGSLTRRRFCGHGLSAALVVHSVHGSSCLISVYVQDCWNQHSQSSFKLWRSQRPGKSRLVKSAWSCQLHVSVCSPLRINLRADILHWE